MITFSIDFHHAHFAHRYYSETDTVVVMMMIVTLAFVKRKWLNREECQIGLLLVGLARGLHFRIWLENGYNSDSLGVFITSLNVCIAT